MRRNLKVAMLMTLCCIASDCSSWSKFDQPWPDQPARRDQWRVWSHDTSIALHGIQMTGDSLTGVPMQKDPGCDSCRVGFARTQVDSIEHGDQELVGFAWVGGIALVFAVLAAMVSGAGGPSS